MISNEETSGRNLYENIKYFLPLLKFIFASNCELNFAHPDDAVYDRLVIIPFNKEIKEEDRDIHLDEKLKKEKQEFKNEARTAIEKRICPRCETNLIFKDNRLYCPKCKFEIKL